MSWPQWPGGGVPQPGVVQASMINPAPNVVNPAASVIPGNQYTPEQWAQMQHQNWQQWAQWQQQFQQWQQQYGAEYQKSITAMATPQSRPTPVQPPAPFFNMNTAAPPPLPVETKPPPPPDDCAPPSSVGQLSFTSAPPPMTQSNFNSAPPPQPPAPKEPFQIHNQFNPHQSNMPSNQGGFVNRKEGFNTDNQHRFGSNQNYGNNNRNSGRNTNWQNHSNRNPQGFGDNRFNQSPSFGNESKNFNQSPSFGNESKNFNQSPSFGNESKNFNQSPSFGNDSKNFNQSPSFGNDSKNFKQSPSFGNDSKNFNQSPSFGNDSKNFNQSPGFGNESKNRGDFGGKRPYNQSDDGGDVKRNKVEPNSDSARWQGNEQNQRWSEVPIKVENQRWNTKPAEARTPTPKPNNPEELTEAEKKFDKQFADWESQFQKWKEQNANHPDKDQYREYEKKWEAWRTQLLDRREQMKIKRLEQTGDSPQPASDKLLQPKLESVSQNVADRPLIIPKTEKLSNRPPLLGNKPAGSQQPQDEKPSLLKGDLQSIASTPPASSSGKPGLLGDKPPLLSTPNSGAMRPSPNMNDQPLDFKKERLELDDEFEPPKETAENELLAEQDNVGEGFLKSASSGGIPGLDLVKDGKDDTKVKEEDIPEENASENLKGPDLEAISRGINSILGDQKLMNMLSLVSQNQSRPGASTTVNTKVDSPKFSPEASPVDDDYGNQENAEFYENKDERFSNNDDQTRSSFNVPNEVEGSEFDRYGKGSNYFSGQPDEASGDNDDFRTDDFDEGPNSWNNLRGPNDFNRGPPDFHRESGNFNRGPDNFNRGPGNFNRGPDNFNRGPGNFNRGPGNFNRGPDNFNRGPDNFNRGPGNFNRGPDNFNRGPDNFNRGPDSFNRGPGNFNRGPDNFNRGSDNFNKGPDMFNKGLDMFNKGPDMFNKGPENYNRGPDNFNKGPDSFIKGPDIFNKGPDNFIKGPDTFNTGLDMFNKGPGNFNRGPGNFNRGPDNLNKGPDSFNKGPEIFNKAPDRALDNFNRGPDISRGPPNTLINDFSRGANFNRGPDNLNKGPGHFNRNADNLNRGFDNFNRGSDGFKRDLENINKGPDRFNKEPNFGQNTDSFDRGPENINRGPDNFNKGPENFKRDPDNFNRGPGNFNRGPDNFNKGPDNFNRAPDNFNRGPDNFNKSPENFNKGPNFGERGPNNFNVSKITDGGPKRFNMRTDTATDNFNKRFKSESFEEGPNKFDREQDNFTRGPSNVDKGHPNFEKMGFSRGLGDNLNDNEMDSKRFQNPQAAWKRSDSFPNDSLPVKLQEPAKDDAIVEPAQEELIWKPNSVIDYDHKPLKPVEPDVIVAPAHAYDYRHKPFNRIPYPQRPKWLTEMVKNYPEFDLLVSRPFEQQLRRYPVTERFEPRLPSDGYQKYDDRPRKFFDERKSYDERDRKPFEDRDRKTFEDRKPFDDRERKSFEDRERKTFDDRERKPFEDRERKSFEDRERKPFEDRERKPFEDRERKSFEDRERKPVEDRERKPFEDRERKSFEDRERKPFEDRERKPFDDRDRKPYDNSHRKQFDKQDDRRQRDFGERRLPDDQKFLTGKKSTDDDRKDNSPVGEKIQNKEQENKFGDSKIFNTKPVPSKPNITLIEDILSPPGRFNRAPRIVIIIRGPPGSGKSFLAKLIKDKEVEHGGSAPRILCLDDYFMVEQEKEVEEDGRMVKVKEMVYEYEECMEASYRQSLMKSFKKTITDGYFNFIVVDNINDKVKFFGEMWSYAKQNGFQVYICQLELDVQTCTKRNIHARSEAEIERCVAGWEHTPAHHPALDATSLIQSGSIPEVEMEEINSPASENMNEEREFLQEHLITSKWDNIDYSNDNLAKLDGTSKPLRASRTMEDYLQLDDGWIEPVSIKPGQKRVRWADLEERREQEKMRAIGFVVGQTNWDRMMDPTMGSGALTQTKYIERYS